MNIPFRDLIEKVKGRLPFMNRTPATPAAKPDVLAKPESEKFARTVRPNAVQTVDSVTAPASSPPMVSLGHTGGTQSRDLPPAVALALEPRVERVLSLALSDVIAQMPEGYLKPRASFDVSRRVLLKAIEVEKGMAAGSPALPVSALYQQMPEIFMHVVPASDAELVPLPFDKVLGELSALSLRQDQMSEEVVQQFETPFLRVTMEETEKFGIPMAPVQLAEMPPVRMEPATARSMAAAEPETAAREKFIPPAATAPEAKREPAPDVTSAPETVESRPVIAFQPAPETAAKSHDLEQLGTGEPAFPRVPASSGPPVPPTPPTPRAPVRIPFDLGELSAGAAFAPTPQPPPRVQKLDRSPVAPREAEQTSARPGQPMVVLPLRPILQTLPPMQLRGDPATVPVEAKISCPFSLIEPQLPTGRVVIAPADFQAAMPAEYRDLFAAEAIDAPVPISLADVLGHLPGDALRMRTDQEVTKLDEVFETPFSKKAQEDAQRFAEENASKPHRVAPAPVAEPMTFEAEEKAELKIDSPAITAPVAESCEARASDFDAREAVTQGSALSGVAACGVTFSDGLSIASNVPAELQLEGLSAVAPTLLQKLEKHMLQTQLGALTCLTVHGDKSPVSFFAAGNVCLTAIHQSADLSAETRRALGRITQQLSHTYAQPETSHVDH